MYNNIVITGTGSYIPEKVVTNDDFSENKFYDTSGVAFDIPHEEIAEKFVAITGIEQRRYASENMTASDMGTIVARMAIEDAGINMEEIDQLIVAHNFGDVPKGTIQTDMLPSIAARIKHTLGIENPGCIAYDVIFGCPGWIQGVIQAMAFIQSGQAKKCLVIATETLSRMVDDHDRDSMIYADGAGACVLESRETDQKEGILASSMASYTKDEAYYLYFGQSNIEDSDPNVRYIKMHGRKIYEFALTHVPAAMKAALDKAGGDIHDVKKILIHQANEKLDYEVVKRFYRLYKIREIPEQILPMSIHFLGNSSVATVPTLYDRIRKGTCHEDHKLNDGDLILFASVGAGMNINCIAYRHRNI